MFIAKNEPIIEFNTHSEIVKETCFLLCKKLNIKLNEDDIEIITFSALFHDIGKLTTQFQTLLKENKETVGLKYSHNEIGWAFLFKYLNNTDIKNKEQILNIVYWHHGIKGEMGITTFNDIFNEINNISLDNMLCYFKSKLTLNNNEINIATNTTSPTYYVDNVRLEFIRSIVITSDRISSNIVDLKDINTLIDTYLYKTENISLNGLELSGNLRFNEQKRIINLIDKKTTILNAPAGFGKTMLGLLYGFKNNNKVIWVTPRNTIALSLYDTINKELNTLNIKNISIQLLIGGELIKTNNNDKLYNSDIIVTNIDNYLAPSFKNNVFDSSALIYNSTVIFDEYHELICDSALMASFVNVMNVRHNITNSNTLLLSASPIKCNHLWEGLGSEKTLYLPGENEHYKSTHDKKYNIKIIDKLPNKLDKNSLVIKNTINSAQTDYLKNDFKTLVHSKFTDDKLNNDYDLLMNENGYINNNKNDNVIGTHILQASLNISFNNLYESIFSPQSTIQRLGRCNRFGEYKKSNIYCINDTKITGRVRREKSFIHNLYDTTLFNLWVNKLNEYNDKSLTLDDFYILYNSFNKDNSENIKFYVNELYKISLGNLKRIYPKKYFNNQKLNKKVVKTGGNPLRGGVNDIFYIIKNNTKDEWVGVFSDDKKNINTDMSLHKIKKVIKRLSNENRYEYNLDMFRSKDEIKIKRILLSNAKYSHTPYIVFDKVYDYKLGIINLNNK